MGYHRLRLFKKVVFIFCDKEFFIFFFPVNSLLANMKAALCLLLLAVLVGYCLSKGKENNIHNVLEAKLKARDLKKLTRSRRQAYAVRQKQHWMDEFTLQERTEPLA